MFKNIQQHIIAAYCTVFKNSLKSKLVALLSMAIIFWLSVSLSNFGLFAHTGGSDLFSFADQAKIIFTSFGTFTTNFTVLSQVLIVITSFLAGVNVPLIAHYFKNRVSAQKAAGTSIFGILIGLFGIGCASCGSVVLSSVIGMSAATGVLTFLPLHGAEFSILGIIVLAWATWAIIKRINGPNVC